MTSGTGGHTRRGVVRSHTVITTGDNAPQRPYVDMATLLSADPQVPPTGLRVQARRVLALLEPGVLSVADVSAHLELPGGVVRSLVGDLILSGHVVADNPFVTVGEPLGRELLERVLDGLQRL
ncbi:DUF742 domain-containing protein [Yinghuangia sp. YIM S09857]|uniref:DUF742 domain-containing protein n=1 Tax=Yinghuangia sp. YIM S09857 TaxID=3436929 RepID=UPI003F533960